MAKQPEQRELTLDEIIAEQEANAKRAEELEKKKELLIASSMQQAMDELANILKKYRIEGVPLITALMENELITYKDVTDTVPIYLVKQNVMKKDRKTGEMKEGDFFFYKGKTILADKEMADELCKKPWAEFMNFVTEAGKKEKNIPVVKEFYNAYCPDNQKQA